MRTLSLVLVSILVGGALGFGLHGLLSDRAERSSTKETYQGFSHEADTNQNRDATPRPTFEDVCQAEGPQAARLLSHYLNDATMEEVIALLEVAVKNERASLNGLIWLIQVRGLELDPAAIITWTKAQTSSWTLLRNLYRHWAVVDPHGALEASLKENRSIRWTVLQSLKKADPDRAYAAVKELMPHTPELGEFERLKWEPLVKRDVGAALEEANSVEDPEERERCIKAAVAAWADLDPFATLAWLDDQEEEIKGTNEIRSIAIEKLADSQPSLAYTKIDAMPRSRIRSMLEGKVAAKWVEQDRDGAVDWMKSQPQGAARDHLLAAMAGPLELSSEELINLAMELGVDAEQSENVGTLRIRMGGSKGESTSVFDGLGLPYRLQSSAVSLANESPIKAFGALRGLGSLDQYHVKEITKTWLERDPMEAATWAADLPVGDFAKEVQNSVFGLWGERAPAEATAFMANEGISISDYATTTIAKQWAQADAEAALNWVNQLEGDIREDALSSAIESVASNDPIQALQYIDRIGDEGAQNQALRVATETWRGNDAPGVMEWLASQPPEAQIDELLIETSKAWVLERPEAASEWITGMEMSPRRDQAVAGMVHALVSSQNPNKDFDAAVLWTRTINNPELQQKWMNEIQSRQNQ